MLRLELNVGGWLEIVPVSHWLVGSISGSRLWPATIVLVPLTRASYLDPTSFELTVITSSSSSRGASEA